jgi:hypothetical protein
VSDQYSVNLSPAYEYESVPSLVAKLKTAVSQSAIMQDVYESLTDAMDKENVSQWRQDEEDAMTEQGDALEIYDLKIEKGIVNQSLLRWRVILLM